MLLWLVWGCAGGPAPEGETEVWDAWSDEPDPTDTDDPVEDPDINDTDVADTDVEDTGIDDTDVEDTGGPIGEGTPVPDPGWEAANWIATGDIGTPEQAWPVGIVSSTLPYIQGTAPNTTEAAFYVFRAGGDFLFEVFVNPISAIPDGVHLHEATGLVFGEKLTPVDTAQMAGSWLLHDGGTYVLEVTVPGGGFF